MIKNEHYLLDKDLGETYYGGSEEVEDHWIDQVLIQTIALMDSYRHPDSKIRSRGAHAKGFAGVRATFTVHKGLPDWVYQGVFKPGEYSAIVRFSKGSPLIKKDNKKDMHGVAIKLLNIENQKIIEEEASLKTQDFTFCNSEYFFISDLKNYARFLRVFRTLKSVFVPLASIVAALTLFYKGTLRLLKASRKTNV